MDYISKLNNHKKFNNNDIKLFCADQIDYLQVNDFVKSLEFDYLNYGTSIYCEKIKTIVFDENFDNYYKCRFRYNGLTNKLLCNYNDLYNLIVINIIYHELWHAKQNKILEDNPNTNYSTLINFSNKLCDKKSLYIKHHDRLYIEYDAIINSIILTFDFFKDFEFNKKSLNILNTHFSNQILSSYGTYGNKETKKYNFPINFINYFLNKNNGNIQELNELKKCIKKYQKLISNNINDLFNGLEIDKDLIDYIKYIRDGSLKSINIIDDIKKYYKSKN